MTSYIFNSKDAATFHRVSPQLRMSQILFWILLWINLFGQAFPVKPIFDLANNMRLVLLPSDTNLGTIIYKLRAQDADENYPLSFTAYDTGQTGIKTSLIDIINTDCSKSVCEADVVLVQPLAASQTYEFNLEVKDTKGESTTVESKLQASEPLGPFIGAPRTVIVPEDSAPNNILESFLIRVNPSLYRGISCRLYPKEAREFFKLSNGFQTNLKDVSRCELKLVKPLDFEAKSAFVLKVVAENAWSNQAFDTRNVAVHEFIVEVGDVADTPPYFLEAPPITRIPESTKVGEKIVEVSAFDGDYAHPRKIRYGLDPSASPYSPFFQVHPDSGIISLRKSLKELDALPTSPIMLRVIAEEMDGNVAKDQTNVEVALIIDDVANRKPKFLKNHYIATVPENVVEGTALVFEGGMDKVQDLDKGDNGILKLFVVGYEDTFEISPSIINQEGKFVISVKNNKKIDFEQTRKINFKIVAEEVGLSGLSASADVTVHVLDENDNVPKFDQDHYDVTIPENVQPGTVVLQVKATDEDTEGNGDVTYSELIGDESVQKTFLLDQFNGQIKIKDNHLLDRELAEEHTFKVVAVDAGGRSAQVGVTVHVDDVNDSPPKFKKRIYQGFMTPDLTRLRNDLQVEAVDGDKSGSRNSHISYEIINGNYDKKFSIDKETGLITVNEPLTEFLPTARYLSSKRRSSRADFDLIDDGVAEINPVITLTVRAYDDGVPSLDSEVPVHIFTEDVSSRMMRFIVPQDPDSVGENQDQISDLISTMTGGDCEIQDIQPYFGDGRDTFTQLDLETLGRNPKTVSTATEKRSRRSFVDVLLRYPANSVVDINAVTSKLVSSNGRSPPESPSGLSGFDNEENRSRNKSFGILGQPSSESADSTTHIEILEQKNAALFWGLVIMCLIIALVVLILLICFCCPGCYLFKHDHLKRLTPYGTMDDDIKVITVKNGEGQELKEARFVEIMKSARQRLKSATSLSGRTFRSQSDRVQRLLPERHEDEDFNSSQRNVQYLRPKQIQVYDPHYHDSDSVLIVRDYPPDRSRVRGPRGVESLDELDARSLGRSEDSRTIYYGRRMPTEKGRIFKVIDRQHRHASRHGDDDVQILRLDDDTRREETFQKIGDSEILNLESGGEDLDGQDNDKTPVRDKQDQSPDRKPMINNNNNNNNSNNNNTNKTLTNRPMAPRRTRSEMDLSQSQVTGPYPEGEFYTAIGPDGKEIILRRYLNEATPRSSFQEDDRGFLSLAMSHLQQQQLQQQRPQQHQHLHPYHQQQQQFNSYQLPQQNQQLLQEQYQLQQQQQLYGDQFQQQQPQLFNEQFQPQLFNEQFQQPQLFSGPFQQPQIYNEQFQMNRQSNQPRRQRRYSDYNSSNEEDNEDSDDESSRSMVRRHKRTKHKSTQSYSDPGVSGSVPDEAPILTPKHHIRSPILEETESSIEAELKSQGRLANDRSRYWYSDPDASYRIRINDGSRGSPEPAYTETKASILRRRNTMAKLLQEEEKQFQGSYMDDRLERRLQSRNRHFSLNDLPNFHRNESSSNRETLKKRWNSVSNDELTRHEEVRSRSTASTVPNLRFSAVPKGPKPSTSSTSLRKSKSTSGHSKSSEPRKFSKFVPNKFRRSHHDVAERYQLYLKPSEQGIPRDAHNIDLQHFSGPAPPKATRNRFMDESDLNSSSNSFESLVEVKTGVEISQVLSYNREKIFRSSRPISNIVDLNANEASEVDEEEEEDVWRSVNQNGRVNPRYMDWYNTGSRRSTKARHKTQDLKDVANFEAEEGEPQGEELISVESTPREINLHDDTESGISSLSVQGSHERKNSTGPDLKPNFAMDSFEAKKIRPISAEVLVD